MKCKLLTSTANIQNYAHPGVMAWGRIIASQLQGGRGSEGDGDSPEGGGVTRVWPPLLKLLRLLKIGMF